MSKVTGLVCGAIVALGVAASLVSNAGFCFAKGKLLSDEEYFKGAIDIVIHDPVDGVVEDVPGASIAKLVHSQKYSDPDEFLREKPRCCRFLPAHSGDGGPEVGILDMVKGVRVVEVSYSKRYLDEGQPKTSKVSAQVAVTSCGKGFPYR